MTSDTDEDAECVITFELEFFVRCPGRLSVDSVRYGISIFELRITSAERGVAGSDRNDLGVLVGLYFLGVIVEVDLPLTEPDREAGMTVLTMELGMTPCMGLSFASVKKGIGISEFKKSVAEKSLSDPGG